MNPLARARHVMARHRWLSWVVVLALAAGAGLVAAEAASGVDAARRSWGATRTVIVSTADIAPGQPLAGAVARRPLPAPLIPAAAIGAVDAGARARQRVAAGEVLVAHDVVATAGPRALIPPGWRAVAVAEAVPTGAAVGDDVSAVSGGVELAPAGVVVAQLSEALLVAFPAPAAAQVAHAAATGELALLLGP